MPALDDRLPCTGSYTPPWRARSRRKALNPGDKTFARQHTVSHVSVTELEATAIALTLCNRLRSMLLLGCVCTARWSPLIAALHASTAPPHIESVILRRRFCLCRLRSLMAVGAKAMSSAHFDTTRYLSTPCYQSEHEFHWHFHHAN